MNNPSDAVTDIDVTGVQKAACAFLHTTATRGTAGELAEALEPLQEAVADLHVDLGEREPTEVYPGWSDGTITDVPDTPPQDWS